MADVKISQLPEVTSLVGSDVLPAVASGVTSKITVDNLAGTLPQVSSSISASYALTASYAMNGGGGSPTFPYTGSAIISGSLTVYGSTGATGSELVTNGDFNGSATGWTLGFDVVYVSNNVSCSYTGGGSERSFVYTNVELEYGKVYRLNFTLSNVVNDTVKIYFDNNSYQANNNSLGFSDGVYSLYLWSDFTGTDQLYFNLWNDIVGAEYTLSAVSLTEAFDVKNLEVFDQSQKSIFSIDSVYGTIKLGSFAGSGSVVNNSIFIGNYSGYDASTVLNGSNFIGAYAGYSASNAQESNFIGFKAGDNAKNAGNSNFFGRISGQGSTYANNSNFLGNGAGTSAVYANNSNFFGQNVGIYATNADNSNFLGYQAGSQATNADNSNFFGYEAGYQATNSSYAVFIGEAAGYSANEAPFSVFLGSGAGNAAYSASFSFMAGSGAGLSATSGSGSILIGSRTGQNYQVANNGIGANNTIIGNELTLPENYSNYINLGGIIFGSGSYSTELKSFGHTEGPYSGSVNGKVGINVVNPQYTLEVAGTVSASAFIGDGSGLTNIAAQAFPFSGSAVITGSINVYGANDVTGSELVTNGNFNGDASGWTLGSDVSYGSNNLVCVYPGGGLPFDPVAYTAVETEEGKRYLVTFTLSNVVNDSVVVYFNQGSVNESVPLTNGTHQIVLYTDFSGTNNLYFDLYEGVFNTAGAGYTLSNVSMTELIEEKIPISVYNQDGTINVLRIKPQSNLFCLGDNAGQGSTLSNNVFFGSYAGAGAVEARDSNFIGQGAGYSSSVASSNFMGAGAGSQTFADYSNFIGELAGFEATQADYSNFLGQQAGYQATNANYSNFLGHTVGYQATNAYNSNFFGPQAGFQAKIANDSNFIGQSAGYQASSASYSTLIGYKAGYNPTGGDLGIKSNNIIIGTNITLEDGRKDSINLGGIIFGTGSYSTTAGNPYSGSANGRVGINQPLPQYSLDVSGSIGLSDVLVLNTRHPLPTSNVPTGSLMSSGSNSDNRPYYWNGATWTALF